jgi:hypothetical protein
MKPVLKAPGKSLLILHYDEPLSHFGFNFNLRPFGKERFKSSAWYPPPQEGKVRVGRG